MASKPQRRTQKPKEKAPEAREETQPDQAVPVEVQASPPAHADPKGVDKLLEGIEFVDEPEAPRDPNLVRDAAEDALERAEKQQRAARDAVERQQREAEIRGVPYIPSLLNQRPRPATDEEREELLSRKKFFMVLEDKEIRRGAAKYKMVAGKVFDNNQYDVESLKRQGVKLKLVDPADIHYRPEF